MTRFPPGDDGNATIVTAGIIAALASLAFVVASVGGARVDAHQARLAADLAAVAGAFAQAYGENGCEKAHRIAALNKAEVTDCYPDSLDVIVTAEVGGEEATARAGPL